MLKKNLLLAFSLCSLLTITSLSANENKNNLSHSKGVKDVFQYDAAKGWWWYKEIVKTDKNETKVIKIKMTPSEKIKFEQNQKIVALLEKQTKLLTKIKKRLDYAFPNLTPKYGINEKTGKKCIANSSADCFVMPLQPDAQRVPVLAKWLRNPNPTNAKAWLQWQAKYFNHLDKVGLGLRFAFLNGGREAYPTDTTAIAYNDNKFFPVSSKVREKREKDIINKVKDRLTLLVFLGKTTYLENSIRAYDTTYVYNYPFWKKININFVFPSEKMKKYVLNQALSDSFNASAFSKKYWKEAGKQDKLIVNNQMFKKFNIVATPTVIVLYKPKKDKKVIWQTLAVGNMDMNAIRNGLIRFLKYNDIIKPKDLQASDSLESIQKNINTDKEIPVKINENKIYKDNKYINLEQGE